MSWTEFSSTTIWGIAILSIFSFAGTLIAIPVLLIRLPVDFFINQQVTDWRARHPLGHIALVVIKNMAGLVFLLAGIAMLVLPGQGLLTILVGAMLIDFPGKRRWTRYLLRLLPIRRYANWFRAKYGKPPFVFGDD